MFREIELTRHTVFFLQLLPLVLLAGISSCNLTETPFKVKSKCTFGSVEPDSSWCFHKIGASGLSFLLPPTLKAVEPEGYSIDSYSRTFADSTGFTVSFDYGPQIGGGTMGGEFSCVYVDTINISNREARIGYYRRDSADKTVFYNDITFYRSPPIYWRLWQRTLGNRRKTIVRLRMTAPCPNRTDCAVANGMYRSVNLPWWY